MILKDIKINLGIIKIHIDRMNSWISIKTKKKTICYYYVPLNMFTIKHFKERKAREIKIVKSTWTNDY